MSNYSYTISTDFLNGKVDSARLTQEIRTSAIAIALDSINTAGDTCTISFRATLSSGSITILAGIVAAHSGEPLPDNTLTKVQQYVAEGVLAPVATDGKPYTLPNCFPGEVILNFAGCSDGTAQRFAGDLFGLQQAGVGTATQILSFLDGMYLAGGHVAWEGGGYGSFVDFVLTAPATTTKAPATSGAGNCNKVPTGYGFNIIVPAAGNGQYDLDATTPVPANDDESYAQTGYWESSDPWLGNGVLTPGVPTKAKYNLFDASLELTHFCKLHLFCSSGARDLIAPAIKPKWVLPEWKMKVSIYNAVSANTLTAVWDLMIARRKTV
jgi:hypothetical protein